MTTTANETFVILDLETTGLDHERDQIIEIAALKVAYDGATGEYREIGRFQTLVALEDGVELSEEITRLTGITAQMLEGALPPIAAFEALSWFIRDSTVVAHNAPFDLGFLAQFMTEDIDTDDDDWDAPEVPYSPVAFICTRAMAKLLGLVNAKLENVYFELLDAKIEGHHRALSDAEAVSKIFPILRKACDNRGIEYRNVVVDSPERPLRFVPSGARVVSVSGAEVA